MKTRMISLIAGAALFPVVAWATTDTALPEDAVLYVAAGSANKVLAIDPVTNKVIQEFSNIKNPHALVTTPDGEYVIAGSLKETDPAKEEDGKPKATVYVIHPQHGHVMSTFETVGMIHHQAITPDGRYVISTHPTQGAISIADLDTDEPAFQVKTGPAPNYTVITSDGKTAYVSNSGNGTVSKIDLGNQEVIGSFEAGKSPEHLRLSNNEATLFAINARAGTVSVIDLATQKITQTLKVGKGAHGLALSQDGERLFATAKKGDSLVSFNLKDGSREELPLSPAPYHLEAIKGTGNLYVSSRKSPVIWVIDQKSFTKVGEIKITGEGHQMSLSTAYGD